jgi:hypothetical protein
VSAKSNPATPVFPDSPQLGEEKIRHGVWKRSGAFDLGDHTNEGLQRLDRLFRRELEDIDDGHGNPKRRPYVEAEISSIDLEVSMRVLLQRRWNAHPNGTDHPDEYYNGGKRPSYWLALVLDYRAFTIGQTEPPPALDWTFTEKYSRVTVLNLLALDGEVALETARVAA